MYIISNYDFLYTLIYLYNTEICWNTKIYVYVYTYIYIDIFPKLTDDLALETYSVTDDIIIHIVRFKVT